MSIQGAYVKYTAAAVVTYIQVLTNPRTSRYSKELLDIVRDMTAEFPILALSEPEYYMALQAKSTEVPMLVDLAVTTKARWVASLEQPGLVWDVYSSMAAALEVTTKERLVTGDVFYKHVHSGAELVSILRDNPVFHLAAHAHLHTSLLADLESLYSPGA